jgi:hypothetical protein
VVNFCVHLPEDSLQAHEHDFTKKIIPISFQYLFEGNLSIPSIQTRYEIPWYGSVGAT